MSDVFPRGLDLPSQSPLFWVTHKDRYLRQLLIKDIQESTGRTLIVYFTDCDRSQAQIDNSDDVPLAEILRACNESPVDLMIETNGGMTDATEKLCGLLRQFAPDLRVIVPRRAKSNGTVIALCGSCVVMGQESELGPIDPSFNGIPAEFIAEAPAGTYAPLDVQFAQVFRKQTRKLASTLLSTGMMLGKDPQDIEIAVESLASKSVYHSHGSSIDMDEAERIGLIVEKMTHKDEFWRKIWLLRTMYQHDCGSLGYSKIFEGESVSSAAAKTP